MRKKDYDEVMVKPAKKLFDVLQSKDLGQCCALDENGKRCKRKAVVEEKYHGESEIYGFHHENHVSWVLTYFCAKHEFKKKNTRKELL